jgi:hypothetical protein
LEIGISQIGIGKDDTVQATSSKVDVTTVDVSAKTGIGEIGSSQVCPINIDAIKVCTNETRFTEVGITHNTTAKVSTSQINTTQILPSPVSNTNTREGEISSSGSIEVQSFGIVQTFHNISLQIQNIELAALSLWQQQLHSTTPIKLNFAITNLPTGQLAEATITSYNPNGTPNTATITLDDDGNGVGWFIDTTPQDNSEFRAGSGGDYFTANPDSQAYGKYDLLTTILHKMGHTLGIINGYS